MTTETHPPYQRGRRAAERGAPRTVPNDVMELGNNAIVAWYSGYDSVSPLDRHAGCSLENGLTGVHTPPWPAGFGQAVCPGPADGATPGPNAILGYRNGVLVKGPSESELPAQGGSSIDTLPDPVNHPTHYADGPAKCTCGKTIECIQITEHMNFTLGNAMKYLWRAGKKGDALEDLKKARWYLDREISRHEKS